MAYDWGHTSSVMALTANCHRGKGQSAAHPNDFNPTFKRKRQTVPITFLRDVFVKQSR